MSKELVDQYIQKHSQWEEALNLLRVLIQESELEEEVKWGGPAYTLKKKNVLGIGAFKHYVALWFFQGSFLKDKQKKLMNAQESKTKALRQWRFNTIEEIKDNGGLIRQYIQEAIDNQKAGKVLKVERRKDTTVVIPPLLLAYFNQHPKTFQQFKAFSPSKQREYTEYIQEAIRESTKQKRIEKIALLILEGKSLYDQYKK